MPIQPRPRLVSYFLDLMTMAVQTMRRPSEAPNYDDLRSTVEQQLAQADKLAMDAQIAPFDFEQARFAVCAFVDETVLSTTSWGGRKRWMQAPLQKVYYETVNAGEEFFKRLQYLAPSTTLSTETGATGSRLHLLQHDPYAPAPATPLDTEGMRADNYSQVLEVYALCLQLGFTGRFFNERDQARLRSIRSQTVRNALPSIKWLSPELGYENVSHARLTPALYEAHAPTQPKKLPWSRTKIINAVLIVVPALTVFGLYCIYNGVLDIYLERFLQSTSLL